MRPIWYTDGACSKNGNPDASGGWAAICINEDCESNYIEDYICAGGVGKALGTTNNRMEMEAIIYAVENRIKGYPLIIRSDSSYAINTFTKWMYNWANNNWIKPDNKIPENLDLVKKYYELTKDLAVVLEKVPGHKDNRWNNYVDGLATGRYSWATVKKAWDLHDNEDIGENI